MKSMKEVKEQLALMGDLVIHYFFKYSVVACAMVLSILITHFLCAKLSETIPGPLVVNQTETKSLDGTEMSGAMVLNLLRLYYSCTTEEEVPYKAIVRLSQDIEFIVDSKQMLKEIHKWGSSYYIHPLNIYLCEVQDGDEAVTITFSRRE